MLQRGDSEWIATSAEVAAVEPWVTDTGRWRDLLAALPRLLPEGARLTSIQFNPDGATGGGRKPPFGGVGPARTPRERPPHPPALAAPAAPGSPLPPP